MSESDDICQVAWEAARDKAMERCTTRDGKFRAVAGTLGLSNASITSIGDPEAFVAEPPDTDDWTDVRRWVAARCVAAPEGKEPMLDRHDSVNDAISAAWSAAEAHRGDDASGGDPSGPSDVETDETAPESGAEGSESGSDEAVDEESEEAIEEMEAEPEGTPVTDGVSDGLLEDEAESDAAESDSAAGESDSADAEDEAAEDEAEVGAEE